MDEINFFCKYCDQSLTADADMVGQQIKCPTCATRLRVPQKSQKREPRYFRPKQVTHRIRTSVKTERVPQTPWSEGDANGRNVFIAGFDMPFLDMVKSMLRLSLAAIPGLFILFLAWMLFRGIFDSLAR